MRQKIEALRAWKGSSKFGLALMLLCPLFVVLMTEINQKGSFAIVGTLFTQTPSIVLFDFLFVSVIFYFILLLCKNAFISGTVTGLAMYILSCVEFYRYKASGAHFTMGDFSLFTNVGDVAEFAGIQIYPMLVVMLLLLALYLTAMFIFNVKFTLKWKQVIPACSTMLAGMVAFFIVPTVSNPIFDVFGVNHRGPSNNFVLEEKFEDNGMIAFLVENITDTIDTTNIKTPENYSPQSIQTMAVDLKQATPKVKPNVIMIMSESYTDFRIMDNALGISDDYYTNIDKLSEEGYRGTAFVPTFGGYTVKTEFELLFGLPIKALNGTQAPQSLIGEGEQTTIASYYKSQGYSTSYMHPYTREFYDRGELYPRYGFDNCYFQEEILGADFRKYRDDGVVFDKAIEQIKADENPSYIHITTMQNHMPYNLNPDQTQLDYYMDGIKNTDVRMGELMENLKNLDEPTVIMMVGDHFPFFTEENNAYDRLGINAQNCQELYEKAYFIWSNYELDYSTIKDETVSTFYLPYVLIDLLDLPENEIVGVMNEQMKVDPIYTMEYDETTRNETLDTLTYDLILGDKYTNDYLK